MKFIPTATITILSLAASVANAGLPVGSVGPSRQQLDKLQVVLALEQARGPETATSAHETATYSSRAQQINGLLSRIYNGDPVTEQEIDSAMRR